jgi:outer membrane protein TolC
LKQQAKWMVTAVMIAAGTSGTATAADRPALPAQLTLQQAVAIAFQSSPVLRESQSRVMESEAFRAQARSALLPQITVGAFEALRTVNLEAQGIEIPEIPGIGRPLPVRAGPFGQFDARAYLNQDILNFQRRFTHRAAGARLQASQADDLNVREVLALSVVVAYLNAQRSQASAATLRQQLSLSRQLLTITSDRTSQGVASTLDTRRAEQQANNLQQSLLEAENSLTATKLELARVLHAQITADYELADIGSFYQPETPSVSDALAAAFQARPDYRAAQAQVQASELDLRASKSERYPTVAFAADYGQSGNKPLENLNTYRVQGSINIPVFLGGRISADVKQAKAHIERAQSYLDEVRAQVETDVLTAMAGVASAKKQVEVAQSTIALASDEVDLSMSRFTGGVTDNTEVINAQDRVSRAEDNRIRALYNLHLALASLQRAAGTAEKTYRP